MARKPESLKATAGKMGLLTVLGAGIGTAVGAAIGNVTVGVAAGAALGLVGGAVYEFWYKKDRTGNH